MQTPRIVAEKTTPLSRWVHIVETAIEFEPGQTPEIYHSLGQADYVAILAITPEGMIPLVRQFRPAWNGYTWELPAGHVDQGEAPESSCIRELREETGMTASRVYPLGAYSPCTLRLNNRLHAFFVETENVQQNDSREKGIDVRNVTPKELLQMIFTGEFPLQLHLGVILRAAMDPVIAPKLRLKLEADLI